MALDYRSDGSLAEWLRMAVANSPGIQLDELIGQAASAPRSWRMGRKDTVAVGRDAIRRLERSGEFELKDGRVYPTRRLRAFRKG